MAQENEPSRAAADRRYELTRKNSALTRLGVSLGDYRKAPKISPILREIQHGKSKALKAMRFSKAPLIVQFLAKYDSISPTDRDRVSIEAVALAAKVDIPHLWGEIMLAMREHSVNTVKIIAVNNHPEVMRKTVEFAQLPGGYRDREHLHTMLGALPQPKNTNIFMNKVFTGGGPEDEAEEEVKEQVQELVDDLEYIFPDASAMQDRVQPKQKALPGK